MSDDERDIDIDVSDDDDSDSTKLQRQSNPNYSQAEKRAHHNALERKRRDHIKDSFTSLREAVPSLAGEKASRAQILKKAAEYISFMRRKNQAHQQDIEDLKRQNTILESQIRQLERAKDSFSMGDPSKSDESDSTDADDPELMNRLSKKPKISNYSIP